jgi:hypothetical protein
MIKTNKLRRKYTRKTKRRTPIGGMSGIAVREDTDETKAINSFIENSTIEYVSKGSNGVTFVATLKPGFTSPYKSTDAETYGMDVEQLLLKLIFFKGSNTSRSKRVRFSFDYNNQFETVELLLADPSTFQEEIDIQNEVYANTMDYLEPICPAIVFSKMYKYNSNGVIAKLLQSTVEFSNTYYLLRSMNLSFNTFDSVGIIGMEFAKGYDTLHHWREKAKHENKKTFTSIFSRVKPYHKQIQIYNNVGLYLILELALKTGYSHADFHGSNIMMRESTSSSYPYFLDGPSMKPLFIDFGLSVRIPDKKYDNIKQLCKDGKYTAALKVLCTIPRKDKHRIDTPVWERHYGWACKADEPKIDMEVAKLFAQRIAAEKSTADKFNQTHPKGPELPLSDRDKQSVIDENEDVYVRINYDDTPPNKYLDFDYMPKSASPYSPKTSRTRTSRTKTSRTKSISKSDDSPQYSKKIHSLKTEDFS